MTYNNKDGFSLFSTKIIKIIIIVLAVIGTISWYAYKMILTQQETEMFIESGCRPTETDWIGIPTRWDCPPRTSIEGYEPRN